MAGIMFIFLLLLIIFIAFIRAKTTPEFFDFIKNLGFFDFEFLFPSLILFAIIVLIHALIIRQIGISKKSLQVAYMNQICLMVILSIFGSISILMTMLAA